MQTKRKLELDNKEKLVKKKKKWEQTKSKVSNKLVTKLMTKVK